MSILHESRFQKSLWNTFSSLWSTEADIWARSSHPLAICTKLQCWPSSPGHTHPEGASSMGSMVTWPLPECPATIASIKITACKLAAREGNDWLTSCCEVMMGLCLPSARSGCCCHQRLLPFALSLFECSLCISFWLIQMSGKFDVSSFYCYLALGWRTYFCRCYI